MLTLRDGRACAYGAEGRSFPALMHGAGNALHGSVFVFRAERNSEPPPYPQMLLSSGFGTMTPSSISRRLPAPDWLQRPSCLSAIVGDEMDDPLDEIRSPEILVPYAVDLVDRDFIALLRNRTKEPLVAPHG